MPRNLDRRPRPRGRRRHHDVSRVADHRRRDAGARLGGGMAVGRGARDDDPGPARAGSRPRRRGRKRRSRSPARRPASPTCGPTRRLNPRACSNRGSAPASRSTPCRCHASSCCASGASERPDLTALRAGARRQGRRRQPRRPSRLGRPHARDGQHGDRRRHRHPGAGAGRDRAVGHLRDPRRHGDQPADRRGAAFHRRQGRLHRQPVPAAISSCSACKAGRTRRWRGADLAGVRGLFRRLVPRYRRRGARPRRCSAASRSALRAMRRCSARSSWSPR